MESLNQNLYISFTYFKQVILHSVIVVNNIEKVQNIVEQAEIDPSV